MSDLVEFLRAQLDEDEAWARGVVGNRWGRWDAVGYMSAAAGVLSLFVLVASASVA